MPTTPYTSVSAILTLQCATCGFYQKTTNPAIASLLAAKHQAGWGSAHVVTTTGASFLDFTTGILPPGVTFIRASTGTYNNSSNILATAGVNVARFNYVAGVSCLLIEPAATNLLSQSNGFGTAPWAVYSGGVLTAAQFISPDGSNNGWSLNNPAGFGGRYQFPINFVIAPYTMSIWAKRITGTDPIRLRLISAATTVDCATTAVLTRVFATMTPPSTGNDTIYVYMPDAATNGTNGIYGCQLETGSVMTSYIPTTTAAATRAIDQATFTIPAGVTQLKYTFDDNSTQTVSVSPGSYTIPANLNRANIKTIDTISGSGSINFDFTTGSLPAGITFTRASIGTYNSSGNLLVTAGNDVARFNYVGGVSNLLIEGSATNTLTQSNNFSAADWTAGQSAVVTAAQFVSPDGTNDGWSLTSGSGNGNVGQLYTYLNATYTISVWVKQIIGSAPNYLILGSVNSGGVAINTTLTRLSFTGTTASGAQAAYVLVFAAAGNTNGIYGVQQEAGSKMTSYIPTTTAAVTRAADSAVFTIPAGINTLTYTFDDGSTQVVSVSPGSYTIPVNLNRANIKSIVGSFVPPGVNFDFTSGVLPGAITFTRASIGTYVNNAGTLITASNDVARFNYVSGVANLLIEPSATNLFTQSNTFSAAIWNAAGNGIVPTAAQFISPDGTNDGWGMASNPANGYVAQPFTFSAIPYVVSVWAKQITGATGVQFIMAGQAVGKAITATITRVFFTTTAGAGSNQTAIQVVTNPGTVGMFGAQFETGSTPSSYIPTTATTVTRSADSAVFTIPTGIGHLTYTFDDNTTQLVTVSAGSYTIPTTLNRPNIKSIVGSA